MKTKLIRYSFALILFLMIACENRKDLKTEIIEKRSYLDFGYRGLDVSISDSLKLNETWRNENILDSLTILYKKKPVTILKISNYPKDPIDGGYVAYYEKSLGVFYLKSTTWRSFTLLKTNNDSTNYFINILLGVILSNSKMFLNPRQLKTIEDANIYPLTNAFNK